MALPEFQRGYVWNRTQVRNLLSSLYRRYPVGGLLVWATDSQKAVYRGDDKSPSGIVKLLLDGQQRMTTLYGIVRGKPPKFFDGNPNAFSNLRFHIEDEEFEFYQPVKMREDPKWVDVSEIMQRGVTGLVEYINASGLMQDGSDPGQIFLNATRLLGINEIELNVEEVTGDDKTIEVVVDIFNRVNSGGTKLSKGDLALAKICAEWPETRITMKEMLKGWEDEGYDFNLDWLLRCVNAVVKGEANFRFLHDVTQQEIEDGLRRAKAAIDTCLNMISGRLGLDHNRVLFGKNAFPIMVRYIDQNERRLSSTDWDKLMFWYVQAGMWGRFSGSTESQIDQDLATLDRSMNNLDELLKQLRLFHNFETEAAHFDAASLGARFYPIIYMLTRKGEAKDWCNGIALKEGMLGKMNRLELHHIFPKSRLRESGYEKHHVNAIANFCFLTKECNLRIGNRLPEEYFREVMEEHPGALESQWIPEDPSLWKIDRYHEFLAARRELLSNETNKFMRELLHEESHWLEGETPKKHHVVSSEDATPSPSSFEDEDEEKAINDLNNWILDQGLPSGEMGFEHTDLETGEQLAIFDLAWPNGIQQALSQQVAVLIGESEETLRLATNSGYRCFTRVEDFQNYVKSEVAPEAAPTD